MMKANSPEPPSLERAVSEGLAQGISVDSFILNRSGARRTRSLSPVGEKEDGDDKAEDDRDSHQKYRAVKGEQDELLLERRKRVIRTSWKAIQFGLDVKAAEVFYERLFAEHPAVRAIFPRSMQAQYRKLYAAVSLAVEVLDQPDVLLPVLKELGRQHAKYGVRREYYELVTDAFLWTLNSYLMNKMPHCNAMKWVLDVADAWEWALTFIGNTMADAAHEELARIRDHEEARLAVEEELRLAETP
jgi:hemoglobin-like flavoprotein